MMGFYYIVGWEGLACFALPSFSLFGFRTRAGGEACRMTLLLAPSFTDGRAQRHAQSLASNR